jgi:hypothetical protein
VSWWRDGFPAYGSFVEEEDGIGLGVPVEFAKDLRSTINL